MHFASQQITMIRGPYAVQDGRLLLGDAIPQPTVSPQAPPASLNAIRGRPIEGRIYGGTASISGEMLLNDGAFDVVLAIANADMPTMLSDLLADEFEQAAAERAWSRSKWDGRL